MNRQGNKQEKDVRRRHPSFESELKCGIKSPSITPVRAGGSMQSQCHGIHVV